MAAVIEYLKAENAFTYRNFHLPLENQGFVYLRGKNGSGKSTPWEILQHLYYGTTSRGLKLNNIVCPIPRSDPKEETGYMGETVIRHDAGPWAGRWLIRQARGHKKYKTTVKVFKYVDDDWSLKWHDGACPKKLADAQSMAADIIGLKKNEFEGCLYLSQGMTHALIEGKPAEKAAYLSYLFGLDRLDRLLKVLKDRLVHVETQLYDIAGMEGQLEVLNQELEQLPAINAVVAELDLARESKNDHQTFLADIEKSRQHNLKCLDDLANRNELEEKIASIELPKDADLKVVEEKLDGMTRRNTELAGLVRDVERRVYIEGKLSALGDIEDPGNIDSKINDLRDTEILCSELASEARKRATLHETLNQLGKVEEGDPDVIQSEIEASVAERQAVRVRIPDVQERANLTAQLDAIEAPDLSVEDLRDQISMVDKDLAVQTAKKLDLEGQKRELKGLVLAVKGGSCPTCHRAMSQEDVKQHLAEVAEKLNEVDAKVAKPTQALADAKRHLAVAIKRESLQAKIDVLPDEDIVDLREQSAKLKTKINQLREWKDALVEYDNVKSQVDALREGDPDDLDKQRAAAREEIAELTALQQKLQQHQDLEAELAVLPGDDLDGILREQQSLASAIPSYTDIRDNLKQVAVLKDRLDAIPKVTGDPEAFREELENLEADEQNTRVKYDKTVASIAVLIEQHGRVTLLLGQVKDIEEKMAEFDKLRHQQLVLGQAVKAVPRLKRRKLHQISCAIRDVLPRYAGLMFSHEPNTTFQVEDDEEGFDLLVQRVVHVAQGDGSKAVPEAFHVPVKGLSGGEKQRLSVALVFTLHGLLDPGKQPDILILDEVDYGLDDNGVASLMALIEEIKGNYGTVIMTSHRPQISGAVFDVVWEASKKDHVSTIRQIEKAA